MTNKHILRPYAHTPNENGDWHYLDKHLFSTAKMTGGFASMFEAENIGFLLGLIHDLGKISKEFQDYLVECALAKKENRKPRKRTLDHKLAGACAVRDLDNPLWLYSVPVLGHHGGIPSINDVKSKLLDPDVVPKAKMVLEKGIPLVEKHLHLPGFPQKYLNDPLETEMFIRMLFSCLVDADYLDTEHHWEPEKADLRSSTTALSIADLWKIFERAQSSLLNKPDKTSLDNIRCEIYEACITAADLEPGVFRLTVPTGGGKTRSGMAFALKHAAKYDLDRVIVAIPYTSIIDQNAQVYREILGSDNVLEHHSAIELPDDDDESKEYQRARLAAENWDAPVVVTTTVQLFESLFSNKPSKCRKLHNLARSVIILDEVQTLPVELLQPILNALKDLVEHYGVSLVLSSATQPAFSGDSPYISGFPDMQEIVSDPGRYFDALQRVRYRIEQQPWSWEKVAEEMRTRDQVLCVVNSRKDALELFRLLDDPDALHLSTLMCQAHRRVVLDEIRQRLKKGKPCRVVSTQLVEAGVDLDFPCVARALGPLDRIVQVAGRCNREGRMDDLGEVIVFVPEDGRAPRGNYATEMQIARTYVAEHNQKLADPCVVEKYFSEVYQMARRKGLDRYGINNLREDGEFVEVAKRAKLIKDNAVALVVMKYQPEQIEKLIHNARYTGFMSRDDVRKLQQYTVNVYEYDYQRYLSEGFVREVIPGVRELTVNYDDKTGILEPIHDPYDFIVSSN